MLDIVNKKSSTAKKMAVPLPATSTKSLSWVSKHVPSTLSEIPIHSSKVKSTKEWLKKALIANSEGGPVHVLAMCGNSGCCKSTAIELICKEMQIEVVVWNEGMIEGAGSTYNPWSAREFASQGDNGRDLFRLSDSSLRYGSRKEEILDDFALHSKYSSLGLVTKHHPGSSSGSSSSNINKHQRIEMILERSRSLTSGASNNKIVLIHDPPQVTPFGHSSGSSSSSGGGKHKSASSVSEAEALYSFILHMGCPVVLIVSDVSGRDEFHYAAERCLPTSIRESVCFESTFFPPITELKIVKILEKIAKAEGLLSRVTHSQLETLAVSSGGDLRHCILQLQLLIEARSRIRPAPVNTTVSVVSSSAAVSQAPPTVTEGDVIDLTLDSDSDTGVVDPSLALASGSTNSSGHDRKRRKQESGHIVHLVGSSYLSSSGAEHGGGVNQQKVEEALSEYTRRDLSFSGMHSAAKLLSAKLDDDGRLDFDPDDVIDRSELGSDLMLSFLQGNCIDNFMEKCRCLYSIRRAPSTSATSVASTVALEFATGMMSDEELPPDVENYMVMMMMTPPGAAEVGGSSDTAGGEGVTELSVDMTCLEQLEKALHSYSDVDLLLTRKYEPGANNIDRDSGIFPDAYVSAIQSRAAAVGRGVGFNTLYEQARSSGTYKAAFLGLKRPKILNMRSSVSGMRQRLTEIREGVLSVHHYTPEGEPTLHSLSLNSDLILCTVPLYRAIKAAQREKNPYQTQRPIFNEWVDWKIDTLQQQQHSSSDRAMAKESAADAGGRMQSLEIDFSKGATIEDDIVDDD